MRYLGYLFNTIVFVVLVLGAIGFLSIAHREDQERCKARGGTLGWGLCVDENGKRVP